MHDLAAFQRAFGAAIARNDQSPRDRALGRALAIHRNTSAKAGQDALADNFPVVRALTGEQAFVACAAAFVEADPPREARLCLYGEGFDAFLTRYAPFAQLPWLTDVAWLERCVVEALFAADARALNGGDLAGAIETSAVLRLHPATRFGAFRSPVASIWRAHQPDAGEDALDHVGWRPEAALVTRPLAEVLVTEIDPRAIAFLHACAAGKPLGVAVETLAGGEVADIFSTLITAGAFA